jgi:hypothetical protein
MVCGMEFNQTTHTISFLKHELVYASAKIRIT